MDQRIGSTNLRVVADGKEGRCDESEGRSNEIEHPVGCNGGSQAMNPSTATIFRRIVVDKKEDRADSSKGRSDEMEHWARYNGRSPRLIQGSFAMRPRFGETVWIVSVMDWRIGSDGSEDLGTCGKAVFYRREGSNRGSQGRHNTGENGTKPVAVSREARRHKNG